MRMRSLKKQGGWIGGAITAGAILYSGKRASDKAKGAEKDRERLVKETSKLIDMELKEDLRKMELSQEQVRGEVQARISASGFAQDSDTFDAYREELEREFGNQINWRKKQAQQEKRVTEQGGEYDIAAMKANRYRSNAGTLQSAIGAFMGGS